MALSSVDCGLVQLTRPGVIPIILGPSINPPSRRGADQLRFSEEQ